MDPEQKAVSSQSLANFPVEASKWSWSVEHASPREIAAKVIGVVTSMTATERESIVHMNDSGTKGEHSEFSVAWG